MQWLEQAQEPMPSHVGQYLGWRNAALTGCDDNRNAEADVCA